MTGFVVGGAIFGALGFLFAPQISAALLSEDQRLKLPKFLEEEEKSPEATKQVRMQLHDTACCCQQRQPLLLHLLDVTGHSAAGLAGKRWRHACLRNLQRVMHALR